MKGPDEVEPAGSNPFKTYDQTTSCERGCERGGHSSGEGCIHCKTLFNYLTSMTDDGNNHLIPLSIKVTEVEIEEELDVEDIKTLHGATDIISATHSNLESQVSHKPVDKLLDTGSLGSDVN